jgi:hypothetical protein
VFVEAEQNVFRLLETDSFQRFRVHWSMMQQKKQLQQQGSQKPGEKDSSGKEKKKKGGLRKFLFSNW